jgi:asparagine synthase (glutamine-hydrolysing)
MIDISLHKNHRKFPRDSVHYENELFLVQTDGIFNGIHTRTEDTLAEHIISEYQAKGESFARDLRGSFLVYLFDKKGDKHLIYTNHIGDKRVYFFHRSEIAIISTTVGHVVEGLKKNQIPYELDQIGAYYMLSYGHMFGERTLINEIKRLKPGHYIRIEHQNFETKVYHKLVNTPDEGMTENERLERLDDLFRKAVSMEFEKDVAYGLASLTSLSGGLDSRMTTWVGHELGYSGMTNFTFARKNSADITIPEQITKKLDHPWICKILDPELFMGEVDEITRLSGGICTYLSLSHGKYAIDSVDFNGFGLLHSGQLGDVILGSYDSGEEHGKPKFSWAASTRLIHKLPESDLEGFDNLEQMLMMNRGFNFILSGNLPIQQYTEVTSPFLDVDFLEFCFSIPLRYRVNHRIYKKWILEKYPGAAAFKWEKHGRKITEKTVTVRGKDIPVSTLPSFVVQGIRYHLIKSGKKLKGENRGMNPFQYWYDTNRVVHENIEQYFKENIDIIGDSKLKEDCEQLFKIGNIHEKAQVLTLLATIKLFWS